MKHLLNTYYRNHHWALLLLINILLLKCQIWFISCILYWTCEKTSWFSCSKQLQTVMILQVPVGLHLFLYHVITTAGRLSLKHIISAIVKYIWMILSPLNLELCAHLREPWWNIKCKHVLAIVSFVHYHIRRHML